jgi:hypothetical protein
MCYIVRVPGTHNKKDGTMARTIRKVASGQETLELMSVGALMSLITYDQVDEALCERPDPTRKTRTRKLTKRMIVYLIIFLCLYFGKSTTNVLKTVMAVVSRLYGQPLGDFSEAALSKARLSVGSSTLHSLFRSVCKPISTLAETPSAFYEGLRLVSMDGSDLDLQNVEKVRGAFPIAGDGGKSGHKVPKLRFNALLDVGSRSLFDAECGAYTTHSERALALPLLERLPADCLLLGDRYYQSVSMMKKIVERGSHFLFRLKANRKHKIIKNLPDGSFIAQLFGKHRAGIRTECVEARIIPYLVKDKDGAEIEQGLLATSLLSARKHPAEELATHYHCRWESEMCYDELKAHLLNGTADSLRSKTADLVLQEFWGLLIAHWTVKKIAYDAAVAAGQVPADISFTGTLEILRRTTQSALPPPKGDAELQEGEGAVSRAGKNGG